MMFYRSKVLGVTACIAGTFTLAACGDGADTSAKQTSRAPESGAATGSSSGAQVRQDKALHDALPANIKSRGRLTGAVFVFPPYVNRAQDGKTLEGATIDVAGALGSLLGVKIETQVIPAFSQLVTGLKSGRYDVGLGPTADGAEAEESFDFVDWIQEFVVFAVRKGNPAKVTSLATTCGRRIGMIGGSPAEPVIKKQSDACVEKGQKPVTMQSYPDGNAGVLAVQSGRSDAFYSSQASLTYFVSKTNGTLELAGKGQSNGFPNLRQGTFVPKDSPLTPILLKSFKKLQADGELSKILGRWDLKENELPEIGVNLGTADADK